MSDKFGDERDPYLYPALNVLRNRLGIRQAKNLQQAAFEMTALRAATLPLGPRVRAVGAETRTGPGAAVEGGLGARTVRAWPQAHSHSMVPGGLEVTSSTTRLTSSTSLVIRLEIRASRS